MNDTDIRGHEAKRDSSLTGCTYTGFKDYSLTKMKYKENTRDHCTFWEICEKFACDHTFFGDLNFPPNICM